MRNYCKSIIAYFVVMCVCLSASAQQDSAKYTLLPDSSNFVKASLIVISPGNAIYSGLGHCCIHLECPVHNLDYYFTFGTHTATNADILSFFAGSLEAQYLSVKPDLFIPQYKMEGREVKEVELNLTLHEQQRLWQLLDEELSTAGKYRFNYLYNCTTMSFKAIEWSLIDEQLEFGKFPEPLTWVNGACLGYYSRNMPWLAFVINSLIGSAADGFFDQDERLSPEMIIPVLASARIVPNNGDKPRPVFKGAPVTILPLTRRPVQSVLTPMVVFGALLALVILITVLEWSVKLQGIPTIADKVLFVLHAIVGLLLLYMSTVTCAFGLHWNWYLVVFNPIPFVLWLVFRKKPWFGKVYGVYAVVLLAFVAMTPFSAQLDMEHQLITLALAVRCASKFIETRKSKA